MPIVERIVRFQQKHPFLFILFIGMILRAIAAIFSRGYGMHDDHFLVIEQAQSWVDGTDYLKWLPESRGDQGPEGHSFFYVGFHYLFFKLLELFRIYDPQWKMLFVRIFHAGISLFVISFGYRIASLITSGKTPYKAALLLAALWFMPFLSVRTLVEMACLPFLMYGTLIILRQEQIRQQDLPGFHKFSFLVAGFFLGLAFNVRYQTALFGAGLGLALLIGRNWKGAIWTLIGFIISVSMFQGFIDLLIWGKPFAELIAYTKYNVTHAQQYIVLPWYNYILILAGLLIPPVSLMLLFGYLRNWRKNFLMFLPVLLFIVFHSIYPNKQERFILPIIPFLIVLGIAGWEEFVAGSKWWQKRTKLLSYSWGFFWALNIVLLLIFTPAYSKRARVEAMSYLKKYPMVSYFVVDDYGSSVLRFPPVFYTGSWPRYDAIHAKRSYADLANANAWDKVENQPDFVVFMRPDKLDQRLDSMKHYLPGLVLERRFRPGIVDMLVHRLNPINANEEIFLYRNQDRIPHKIGKNVAPGS
jgi:hypothetical protein